MLEILGGGDLLEAGDSELALLLIDGNGLGELLEIELDEVVCLLRFGLGFGEVLDAGCVQDLVAPALVWVKAILRDLNAPDSLARFSRVGCLYKTSQAASTFMASVTVSPARVSGLVFFNLLADVLRDRPGKLRGWDGPLCGSRDSRSAPLDNS